jgi:hypothetical protein
MQGNGACPVDLRLVVAAALSVGIPPAAASQAVDPNFWAVARHP